MKSYLYFDGSIMLQADQHTILRQTSIPSRAQLRKEKNISLYEHWYPYSLMQLAPSSSPIQPL